MDGNVAIICSGFAAERHTSLFGRQKWPSTFLSALLHGGLFYIPLRGLIRCYYRCITLSLGWGRSVHSFTKLLRPPVRHFREKLLYRVLPYINNLLLAPCPHGRLFITKDCPRALKRRDGIFATTGLTQHPDRRQKRESNRLL